MPLRQPAPVVDDASFAVDLALPYKEARAVLNDSFETRYLDALLARANGNISAAARLARMTRSHLSRAAREAPRLTSQCSCRASPRSPLAAVGWLP